MNQRRRVQDYPEHRLQFFSLLRAITNACGSTLFAMSPQQLKLVIDSIVWAFRHTERNVADTGLNLLSEMLTMFDGSDVATQFYQSYYMNLVREIFAVLTGGPPSQPMPWTSADSARSERSRSESAWYSEHPEIWLTGLHQYKIHRLHPPPPPHRLPVLCHSVYTRSATLQRMQCLCPPVIIAVIHTSVPLRQSWHAWHKRLVWRWPGHLTYSSSLMLRHMSLSKNQRKQTDAVFGADTFHKPGLKMQTKILHHLFLVVSSDVIKAPLWDVAAQGPTAFPNNSTYVNQQVSQLLTTSFPNMQPRQVEVIPLPPPPLHRPPCPPCTPCSEPAPSDMCGTHSVVEVMSLVRGQGGARGA